jgi:hypothetical protein
MTPIEEHVASYLAEHGWEGPLGQDLGLSPGQEVWRREAVFEWESEGRSVFGIHAAFVDQMEVERRQEQAEALQARQEEERKRMEREGTPTDEEQRAAAAKAGTGVGPDEA